MMQYLKNLRLRAKLMIGFAVFAAFFMTIVTVIFTVRLYQTAVDDQNELLKTYSDITAKNISAGLDFGDKASVLSSYESIRGSVRLINMKISISNSTDIVQKIQSIDERTRVEIARVQEKLQQDIQLIKEAAEGKIMTIQEQAEKDKKFEVASAAQVIRDESQEMVQEIENLAYTG